MIRFATRSVAAIGEAMVEMAPVDDGRYRRGFAGDTFNTAWHMAQILPSQLPVRFITRVGQDGLSSEFVREAEADGLDIKGISRDPTRIMGLYMIELNDAERSFHYWRQHAAARLLADDPGALRTALDGQGLIHLSGVTLAILDPSSRQTLFDALRVAREGGAVISFDPNIRPKLWSSLDEVRAVIPTMLAMTDIALPSFDDETLVWADATPFATIDRMQTAGVREVVVKDGAGAITLGASGSIHTVQIRPVDRIKDTTGAGDAFNAGFLAARLTGKPPDRAVDVAQRLSGQVICHYGARIPKDIVKAMDLLG